MKRPPKNPAPQAGTSALTPSRTMTSKRVDAARIRVTLASGGRDFSFIVLASGLIQQGG